MASSRKSLSSKFSMEMRGKKSSSPKPSKTSSTTAGRKATSVQPSSTDLKLASAAEKVEKVDKTDRTRKTRPKSKTDVKEGNLSSGLTSISRSPARQSSASRSQTSRTGKDTKVVRPKAVQAKSAKTIKDAPETVSKDQQSESSPNTTVVTPSVTETQTSVNIPTTSATEDSTTATVSLKDVNLDFKDVGHVDSTCSVEGKESTTRELFRPIFRLGSHESQKTDEEENLTSLELNSDTSSLEQATGSTITVTCRSGILHRTVSEPATSTVSFSISESSSTSELGSEKSSKTSLVHRESLNDELEDMSLSSSGFSPCSTTASFRSFDGRSRIDDFSDDNSDCPRLRESIDLSDDMQDLEVASFTVPLNKPLRIVTSMDRSLRPSAPDRRASSPATMDVQTGGGLLKRLSHHLLFVDFMRRKGLSSFLNNFPSDMTIDSFR